MAVTRDKPAPYAPAKAILEIIDRYRSRGLPSPVDTEVLGRAGILDSLIPRTLQALQTLDLIDDNGKPTATFEGIRVAPEAEFKKRLGDWLKGAYADVFAFADPSTDDETRIRDAFRTYQPVGQQARMVTLFLGLCTAAGLVADKAPQVRSPGRPRPAPSIKMRTPRVALKADSAPIPGATNGLPAPLAGLLASLPPEGEGWTSRKRDKFLSTFEAVLDFCFPIDGSEDGADGTETATADKAAAA